jgi:hypothetical protein
MVVLHRCSFSLVRAAVVLRIARLNDGHPHPTRGLRCRVFFFLETIMQNVTLVGIDLSKHSFHIHGLDRHGNAVSVSRWCVAPPKLIRYMASY